MTNELTFSAFVCYGGGNMNPTIPVLEVNDLFFFFFHSLLQVSSVMGGEELMEDESGLSSDPEELAMEIENCENKVNKLQAKIVQEDTKMEKYRVRTLITV